MLCLDASVVVCIATGETSNELDVLMTQWSVAEESFVAPNVLGFEFTNALYKAVKKGIEPRQTASAFETFRKMNIELIDCSRFHEEALALAATDGMRASYDAHYLVVAAKLGIDLYTCDFAFFNALRGKWPQVHAVAQRGLGR